MAIHGSANPANFRRSVEKYLVDTFVGATGIPTDFAAGNVWWPGARIATEELSYFLRVQLNETRRQFYAAARDDVQGYATQYSLGLEVYVKRIAYQANPHILEQCQALLRGGLVRGTAITIRNYDGDGLTSYGAAIVETANPPRVREEAPWSVAAWDLNLSFVERDTAS